MSPYQAAVFVVFSTFVVFALALLPGLALLQVARRSRWRFLPTGLGTLLLMAPVAAYVALFVVPPPQPVSTRLDEVAPILIALTFFPGFVLILNRWLPPSWALGPRACTLYLLPYVVLAVLRDAGSTTPSLFVPIVAFALLMLLWPRDRWRPVSHALVGLVLIAPVPWPVWNLLQERNAFAVACSDEAGTRIGSPPSNHDTVALEIQEQGCSFRCQRLLLDRRVAAIEAATAGAVTRYTLEPAQPPSEGGSATAPDGRACTQTLESADSDQCLTAEPIDGFTARYLVRTQWTTGDDRIRRARAEVVDNDSGDVVAWTVQVTPPDSDVLTHYAWMLEPFMTLPRRCEPNGMRPQDFIDAWFAGEG